MTDTTNSSFLGDDDLITNTASRLPVCLCLDISGSMQRDGAIDLLNEGVNAFYDAVLADDQAKDSCEICVVTFNSEVTVVSDFATPDKRDTSLRFEASGGTAMAHGVNQALDLLQERKNKYKANGIDYYQPWLVLITDGKPGDTEDIPAAQERVRTEQEAKRLVIFPIAVGSDADPDKYHSVMNVLNGFCLKPKAIHLKDLKFNEFFEWLGKSVSSVSASQVGDSIKLDTTTMEVWGEI